MLALLAFVAVRGVWVPYHLADRAHDGVAVDSIASRSGALAASEVHEHGHAHEHAHEVGHLAGFEALAHLAHEHGQHHEPHEQAPHAPHSSVDHEPCFAVQRDARASAPPTVQPAPGLALAAPLAGDVTVELRCGPPPRAGPARARTARGPPRA